MTLPKVLDTSALISWPLDSLEGGFAVDGQRFEVERISPSRMLTLEAARIKWSSPTADSVKEARKIAIETGDLDGLSITDLHLFALAVELGGKMHTDDYRLQNLCGSIGLQWRPVETKGITKIWLWEIRCQGCGILHEGSEETRAAGKGIGECKYCGSELKIVKK